MTDIAPDETKCLVVLMKTRDGLYIAPGLERRPYRGRLALFSNDFQLNELPQRAVIRLRDRAGDGDSLLSHDVNVVFADENGELKVR